jgi:hypothetical protein
MPAMITAMVRMAQKIAANHHRKWVRGGGVDRKFLVIIDGGGDK